jgi:uncharacterized protein with HEPN domain
MLSQTRQRLLDALESCRAITKYVAGMDLDDYERNDMAQDAVERRLGSIGEALNQATLLDPDLGEHFPELRQIVGMRNHIIHGYHAVDDEIVWDIVQNKLPRLRQSIEELLGDESSRTIGKS